MSKRWTVLLALAGFLISGAVSASATTYYVDYASGNDANNGTSKTSPWQHAPGMQGCSANCSGTRINGGDSIILKGGVTWPNAVFEWSLPGGSSGNPVYIGVDKSWYAGSSWTRPILNAGGAGITSGSNVMIKGNSYVTLDNVEMEGMYWDASTSSSYPGPAYIDIGENPGFVLENSYCHGWSHGSGVGDNIVCVVGTTNWSANTTGISIHDNVFDGTDSGANSGEAIFGTVQYIYNNYIHNLSNGIVGTFRGGTTGAYQPGYVHDNTITNINHSFDTSNHENCFEENSGTDLFFYNNICAHTTAVNLWFAPYQGYTDYIWNNLTWDSDPNQANVMDFEPPLPGGPYPSCTTSGSYCTNAGAYVAYNNTIECGPDSSPSGACNRVQVTGTVDGITIVNNHLITSNGTPTACQSGSPCTITTNMVQALATANGQGYSSRQAYAFSPTSSSDSTVGQGTNLSFVASGNLASLGSNTTYACSYNSTAHAVSCPALAAANRPAAWDIGAYQYGNGTSASSPTAPLPPIGLTAVVQ